MEEHQDSLRFAMCSTHYFPKGRLIIFMLHNECIYVILKVA